jgi:uncharacterized repeat protein (TIGR01451 family)
VQAPPPSGPPPATPEIADLKVSSETDHSSVPLGGEVTDTITVTNLGPSAATGADIVSALSADAQLVGVQGRGANCVARIPVHCTLPRLPAGASETLHISFRPLRSGPLLDTVSASADQSDPNQRNNVAQVTSLVRPGRAAATLGEISSQPVAGAGALVRFTFAVAGHGLVPGVGTQLCARLPASLRLVSAAGAQANGSIVCWTIGELAPGGTRRFQLLATVAAGATPGAQLSVPAALSGTNFTTRNATAAVQVQPPFVACPASAGRRGPLARIAC